MHTRSLLLLTLVVTGCHAPALTTKADGGVQTTLTSTSVSFRVVNTSSAVRYLADQTFFDNELYLKGSDGGFVTTSLDDNCGIACPGCFAGCSAGKAVYPYVALAPGDSREYSWDGLVWQQNDGNPQCLCYDSYVQPADTLTAFARYVDTISSTGFPVGSIMTAQTSFAYPAIDYVIVNLE